MVDFVYVNPEYEEYLRRRNLLKLETLLEWQEGQRVRRRNDYEIFRIQLPERSDHDRFYLQKDRRVPIKTSLLDILRFRKPASKCYKTYRTATILNEAGIDTMHLLCLIERRHFALPTKAAALVTVIPGQNLHKLLLAFGLPHQRRRNPSGRVRLLYELGGFIFKLHKAKLYAPDLNAKNIHVTYAKRTAPDSPWWRFGLIDLENVSKTFSRKKRERQLGEFFTSLSGLLTASDLLRVLVGYIGAQRIGSRSVRRKLLRKFFPNAAAWVHRVQDEAIWLRVYPDDRPMEEEESYHRIRGTMVNRRYRNLLEELGLLRQDGLFSFRGGTELHKQGLEGRQRCRFETIWNGKPLWLYLKRTHRPPLMDQFRRMWSGKARSSTCFHERRMMRELSLLRIPVPVAVAYAQEMNFCFEKRSALITEGIVGQSLEKFVPRYFARSAGPEKLRQRRAWIRQLAELIGRFHRSGYCHRDLYLCHLFISFRHNGQAVFHMIDLARCFQMKLFRRRWLVKDLASLNYSSGPEVTRTDRMRFMLRYLNLPKLNGMGKKLIKSIVAKSRRIARHDQRHRRVTVERPYEDSISHRSS